MKTFLALLAFMATATCQSDDLSSPPFQLVLESSNSTLNGTVLGACHEGAATEGFCYTGIPVTESPSYGTIFYYNVSSSYEDDLDHPGYLHYILEAANFNITSTMEFSFDPTSNLAIPIISPGEYGSSVSFDDCGYLYIADNLDDNVNPPTFLDPPSKLENWYICTTRWSYTYVTLVWKIGPPESTIENPTCTGVQVTRVFI